MSHENSAPAIQRELASEYGRYVKSNSNKGILRFIVKGLLIPFVAILIILTGASFILANFSPAMYMQARDIIFEKVDFEKLTGQTNSVNKEYLDSLLILNPEKQQGEAIVLEENPINEKSPEEQTVTPLN